MSAAVSVVITTYNRAGLLARAVDSALGQRFPTDQVEVIVVDDGSTDGTRELVRTRYGEKIRYFHKPNGGMNSASQFGIEQAQGAVVALLDSDDYWYEDKLARCMPLFAQSDAVVAVLHDLDRVESDSGVKRGRIWGEKDASFGTEPRDALQHYLSGKPIKAITSGLLLKRETVLKILPFPEGLRRFHDAYFMRNILFFGKICAIHDPLGAYAIHGSNDYGFKPFRELSDERLEQAIVEARLMSESFNRRCAQFGISESSQRNRIQRFALAEILMEKHRREGTIPAIAWLAKNDLRLGVRERLHLTTRLTMPPRVASFVNNRILVGNASVD